MRLLKSLILINFFGIVFYSGNLNAQNFDIGGGVVELDPITIPVFGSAYLGFVANASILSWLSFAGTIISGVILLYWGIRIIYSGYNALRSEGDPTKLQEAYSQFKSNFIGIFMTLIIPVILSIVGVIFGIGSVLQWPVSFQVCNQNSVYQFYFEALLKEGDRASAERMCGI